MVLFELPGMFSAAVDAAVAVTNPLSPLDAEGDVILKGFVEALLELVSMLAIAVGSSVFHDHALTEGLAEELVVLSVGSAHQ